MESSENAKLERQNKGIQQSWLLNLSERIIEESNSTITVKSEDGEDIKLTILKRPIALSALEYEIEASDIDKKETDQLPDKEVDKEYSKKKDDIKYFKTTSTKAGNLYLLKEPLALDNINWKNEKHEVQSSITLNVKTEQGLWCTNASKRNKKDDYQSWKQNALAIFEFSYVYPFIHAGNKYKCFVCLKPYLDASLLNQHVVNEHSIKEVKQELNNRVRDKNLKVDVTYLQCRICSQTLSNLQNLKIHLKVNHEKKIEPSLQDNIIPFKLGGEHFDCQICGERFLKLRLLVIHMSKHFNNYSCEFCGAVFISLNLLKRHLQTHESGNFPCDKCDKVFSNSSKRTLHMRGVHLKQFPRRCPICSERFNSNYQRTKHLRIVHNQTTGLFRCDTCGREYDLKYHLLIHIRSVHLQERNQECPVCHARFFSKYCLSRHMVIHTGEKNFKCEVCGKAYARRKNLREHSRSHEAGVCSICGQNYGDQNHLVAHVNSVHAAI